MGWNNIILIFFRCNHMRMEELPTLIRTRPWLDIVTTNVIKAKINVKLCPKPYKRGVHVNPMYYLVYFNTLKYTAPPSRVVRIYKSLGGMIEKLRSLFKRYLRKFINWWLFFQSTALNQAKALKIYFYIICSFSVCMYMQNGGRNP